MKQDRNIVLEDEKERILDFTEYKFIPPETGIYEGDLRYYAANLEWARYLEGHISWLATVAAWPDAEDERYHAIQQVLIFLRGIDVTLKEDIREGIYEAFNGIAAQIVSGRRTNISVDESGNVTDPTTTGGSVDLPDDDPATADINETKASRYAAALAISKGVNTILADLNTLYGADATADNSVQVALAYMQQYVISGGMLNALTVYWDARAQNQAQITSVDREDLADYIYCNPFSELYVATTQFIASLSAYTPAQRNNIIGILHELDDTQFSIWYNKGAASLSTEYNNAPCEPVPTQELVTQWGIAGPASSTLKKNHRYLITAEGYLLDPDGSIQDAWYHKEPSSSAVFDDVDFNPQVGGATHVKPSSNEVPYNVNHKYTWTFDMGSINASLQWSIARDATLQATSTSPTSGLKITIKDLGIIV
jgi:hypothetical protein